MCRPENVLFEGSRAYVRYDSNSLSRGHVLVVPRRHVASYFDMTIEEKTEIQSLLDRAQARIAADHSPDGYNIGVNIGVAAPMAYFPFSGWKDSFLGVLHGQGRDAIEFYTDKKVVVERWPKEWSRKF